MNEFLIALAGGSVGAVVTWLITQGGAVLAVPGDVEQHNRLARERDEDLEQWVADDHLRLVRELRGITARMAAPGPGEGSQLYSGAHARALAHAKERALHRYRDQEREAERFVAELAATEGGWHRAHRRQERVAPLALTAPERVQPVLDLWRSPSWMHPPGVASAEVADPTRRTLEGTLRELEAPADR